ncbi:hypothetical protein [Streptomyces aureoversilis]|uniref:Uncharacterized protein n=1 Tax=Streptomyces aureoversilis TaxID=67277 RepID=A0ABW0A7I4_9ACTN
MHGVPRGAGRQRQRERLALQCLTEPDPAPAEADTQRPQQAGRRRGHAQVRRCTPRRLISPSSTTT